MSTDITQRKFPFDWGRLNSAEFDLVTKIIGVPMKQPDFVLAPEGFPYLYRWNIVRTRQANTMLHIQVANDWRDKHDHPWDNTSVYLTDGAVETIPYGEGEQSIVRHAGDMVFRKAEQLHRLDLVPGADHCITLFTTGAHRREWGFMTPNGWLHNKDMVDDRDGFSLGRKAA